MQGRLVAAWRRQLAVYQTAAMHPVEALHRPAGHCLPPEVTSPAAVAAVLSSRPSAAHLTGGEALAQQHCVGRQVLSM